MQVNSRFDGGNIRCISVSDPRDIRLEIRNDHQSEFYQWFYFRLTGAKDRDCRLNILNAGGAAYAKGWDGYQAVASVDRETWFRVPTTFDGTTLGITVRPSSDAMYFAYFAPYSLERHADLIADALASPRARLEVLGSTLDGRDMDLLVIGEADESKRSCWAVARQHPGETMAEWWMEGYLGRLLDEDDPVVRALLDRAVFYVVPNMNPDGSFRGHLRTNAAGANLNREWQDPSAERSPEVAAVRRKMHETGVGFCLDVHGDESLPYNFIAGTEGIESWNPQRDRFLKRFKSSLRRLNPDFQSDFGYPKNKHGAANVKLCSNYVAQTFACPAMTLEMPFKDSAVTPDPRHGWSPERCRKLAFSCVDSLFEMIEDFP